MNPIQLAINRLVSYAVRSVWVHNKMLYSMLPTIEGRSKQEVLTTVISSLQKGYIGKATDKLTIPQGTHNKEKKHNSFNIVMIRNGTYESFQTNNLASNDSVTAQPRWFGWDHPQTKIETQLKVVKLMTGEHK